jgi:hypothetical protein
MTIGAVAFRFTSSAKSPGRLRSLPVRTGRSGISDEWNAVTGDMCAEVTKILDGWEVSGVLGMPVAGVNGPAVSPALSSAAIKLSVEAVGFGSTVFVVTVHAGGRATMGASEVNSHSSLQLSDQIRL